MPKIDICIHQKDNAQKILLHTRVGCASPKDIKQLYAYFYSKMASHGYRDFFISMDTLTNHRRTRLYFDKAIAKIINAEQQPKDYTDDK